MEQANESNPVPTVFIVDDDAGLLRLILSDLEQAGVAARGFESAEGFLHVVDSNSLGCVLLDLDLPNISGEELQKSLVQRQILMPIIFLSGTANVATAAAVMKRGALDLIEKPYDRQKLLAAIGWALEKDAKAHRTRVELAEIRSKIAMLTPRERDVASLLCSGLANKEVANALGLSNRTVEIHRSRVMAKMACDSVAEFVLAWTAVEIPRAERSA